MKVQVSYRCGKVATFTVPEDILVVDFIALANNLGTVRRVEFL